MKRHLLLISAVLLSVIAGVQTAMAQKVTLYSAGRQWSDNNGWDEYESLLEENNIDY